MNRRIVVPHSDNVKTYSSDRPTKRVHTIEEYIPPKPAAKTPKQEHDTVPLELMPTLRTLKGYGKRMNALGALRVARALERIVEQVMPHIGKYPELTDVILEAKHEADSIRSTAFKDASFEQDDSEDGEDL